MWMVFLSSSKNTIHALALKQLITKTSRPETLSPEIINLRRFIESLIFPQNLLSQAPL